MDEKTILREKMKLQRKNFDKKSSASEKICSLFLSCPEYLEAETLCVYMSSFGEADTSFIISHSLEDGKKVCVPVSRADGTLKLSLYNGKFKKGLYGIYEPADPVFVDFSFPQLILIPGLAFDKRGNRLGFGKGYYDRFLSEASGIKVGLCYAFQLADKIPSEPHDIKMDMIITENGITNIKNQSF